MTKEKDCLNKPVPFVNSSISEFADDFIGFDTHVDAIHQAIDNGGSMIGIIGNYGSGKSSLTNLIGASKNFKKQSRLRKYKKPIKVSMWDTLDTLRSKKSRVANGAVGSLQDDESLQDNDNLTVLNKSFLYQVAAGKSNNLASYVAKRINKNTGLLSFSVRSKLAWLFYILTAIFLTAGIVFSYTNFNFLQSNGYEEINWFENNNWFVIIAHILPYFFALMFFILGIKNSSISFSSWKSEGKKQLDSSDVYDIYNDVIKSIRKKRLMRRWKYRKRLIVVEDLDRINDNDDCNTIMQEFIKEMYKFDTLSKKYGIVLVLAIKSKSELKIDIDYSKIFDYHVELRPIHFEDYISILQPYLEKQALSIYKLTNKVFYKPSDEANINTLLNLMCVHAVKNIKYTNFYEELAWVIKGKGLTIRDLKQRLNNTLLLYSTIKNHPQGKEANIKLNTCAAVTYLHSKYENDFYTLNNNDTNFAEIIKETQNINIDAYKNNWTPDDKLKKICDKINLTYTMKPALNLEFVEELSKMLANETIDKDYRLYFYSYPKKSHIKNIEVSELEDYIIYPQKAKEMNDDRLIFLVEFILGNNQKNEIIENAFKQVLGRKDLLPLSIVNNKTLLEYAYMMHPQNVIELLSKYLLWDDKNAPTTLEILIKLVKYDLENINIIITKYSEAIYEHVTKLPNNSVVYLRKQLLLNLKNKIELFSFAFVGNEIPLITSEELENISNDMLEMNNSTKSGLNFEGLKKGKSLDSLKIKLINSTLLNINNIYDILISFNNKLDVKNYEVVKNYIYKVCSVVTPGSISNIKKQSLISFIDFLHINNTIDDYIFNFVSEFKFSDDTKTKIVAYINHLRVSLSEKYCLGIAKLNISVGLNESILRQMYDFYLSNPNFLDNNSITILSHTFSQLIKTSENCVEFFSLILNENFDDAVNLFETLDFNIPAFKSLSIDYLEEITKKYTEHFTFDTLEEAMDYLKMIGRLVPSVEKTIFELDMSDDEFDSFIELINGINDVSDTIIKILEKFSCKYGLADNITTAFLNKDSIDRYLIGKTLWYENFSFYTNIKNTIDFEIVFQVYKDTPIMQNYMEENEEFLDAIYENNNFDDLDARQLALFKDRPVTANLLEAQLKSIKNAGGLFDNYIANISSLSVVSNTTTTFKLIREYLPENSLSDNAIKNIKKIFNHSNLPKGEKTSMTIALNKLSSN